MDPVFICCDKVKFQIEDYKIFKVDFSNGDNLEGVFFRKNRDYYITSMSCFITLEQDLKELQHYDDIKKISGISNKILKKGIEHLYEEKVLEVTLENVKQKIEFQADKSKRGLSVHAVEFFDEKSKMKRLVYVYSPYKELKAYGLKFENKGKSVYQYTIVMTAANDKLYLEKKLFFDKKKAIDEIIKASDRQNVIFMRYNGQLYATRIEFSRYYFQKLEEAVNFDLRNHIKSTANNFHYFLYYALFQEPKKYDFLLEKNDLNKTSLKHPTIMSGVISTIKGGVDLYLTRELYRRNKSIFKNSSFKEITPVDVTPTLLSRFRTQLNDPDFSISRIYGFNGIYVYQQYRFEFNDIVIPDFNAYIKIKSPKEVNNVFKKTLEVTVNLMDNNKLDTFSNDQKVKTIKEAAPKNLETLAI